jgi:hypothetical protein
MTSSRHWLSAHGIRDHTATNTYHYDTGSYWPVDQMWVRFAEANTVVHLNLQSRPCPDADWQQRFQGLVYSLQTAGITVRNEPLAWPTATDRYWRLQIVGGDEGTTDRHQRWSWAGCHIC